MSKHKAQKKDIYIITNDINQKVYIGQTVNPQQRWGQYVSLVKKNPNAQVISRAMSKYGIEHFTMSILESQVVNYDEREKYWIKKYNSIVPNGYNVAEGGQGSGSGLSSPSAKITSEKKLEEIRDDLIQNILSLDQIARKYNLSYSQVESLNHGKSYYDAELNYPLRPSKRFSEEKLKQITYSLKYELDKTLKQIAEEFDINESYLNDINQGKSQHREYLTYPLRVGKMKYADFLYPEIIDLLLQSELSQKEIAQKYNLSQQTISNINLGKVGRREGIEYPIRKKCRNDKKNSCLSPGLVDEICELLKNTSLSLKEIGDRYEVGRSVIAGINSGKTKKYRNDKKYIYPIRKK